MTPDIGGAVGSKQKSQTAAKKAENSLKSASHKTSKRVEAGVKRPSTSIPQQSAKKRKCYDEKPIRANRRDERREIMVRAKEKWEQLRPKATSKEKSIALVNELLQLLSGRIVEFVFRHDGSRIVQWMLADGDEGQKAKVLAELMEGSKKPALQGEMPFFVQLACDRYGHHLAFKVLRVSDKRHRSMIFDLYLKGNTTLLMRNAHGSDVLDFAFQTVLTARSKAELVLELLYGKEKKLLDTVRQKLFAKQGEPSTILSAKESPQTQSLFAQSLELVGETFKDVVVESAGLFLAHLIEKENLLSFEIIHSAVKEYLQVVMTDYPKAKSQEMAVSLGSMLVHFAHTKPGVHVAVTCVKILDAKHRKKVLRALKTHVRKLLEDEFGHRLILALFEWVDDTRLVGKTISAEIFSSSSVAAEIAEVDVEQQKSSSRGGKTKAEKKGLKAKQKAASSSGGIDLDYVLAMCQHKYARMPLLSLLFGRDTRYFNPDVYGLVWKEIDIEKFGQLSKKDADTRRSELRVVFDGAVNDLMRKEMSKLLRSRWSAPIVLGSLLNKETNDAVLDGVMDVLLKDGEIADILSDTCARKTLATLVKIGGEKFASVIVEKCGVEVVGKFAGCDSTMPIARNLVAACGRRDAEKALKRAERRSGSVR